MQLAPLNSVFQQEAEELLDQVESVVLAAEADPGDSEKLNRLFRLFHTIKGGAAMLGLDAIAKFTHQVESVLDAVRGGRLSVTPELARLVLASKDLIAQMVQDPDAPVAQQGEHLARELTSLMAAAAAPVQAAVVAPRLRTTFRIHFQPLPTLSQRHVDLRGVLSGLRALGECSVDEQPIEPGDSGEHEAGFHATLTTTHEEAEIRHVFGAVEQDSEIVIDRGLMAFVSDPPVPQAAARSVNAVLEAAAARQPVNARTGTLRVPSERLDHLVTLVGELVINQSRLNQALALSGSHELAAPVEAMEGLIAELRDSVLCIRMLPVSTTFNRFKRLVHDLSAELHKEVDLVLEGEDTEVDKTVLDQLGDPLVHLIRNSLDHGIEPPEQRLASGKPRRGQLRLSAAHDGAHVVITIQDDGRGIDKAAVRAKAIAKGLIDPAASLSDQEIHDLLTLPGFSTASHVTQVSGRGVGMDVVKRAIEDLRGSLVLSSETGRGTCVRLTLPLTLAIIDGLLVEIAGDRFIVPMSAVLENVELEQRERNAHNRRNVINVRGELVPYVCLRSAFGLPLSSEAYEKVVVCSCQGQRVGVVVDRVLGSHQTVIQPLGACLHDVRLFSGTTILGDGRVALILDLGGALRQLESLAA
jgi:two-component system chemotaxis sensor kinase CheA